ncbi:hypothetical protein GBAR_LOCUS25783 [Geodia barretti]|uniref:Uncharacterized protein n=1 Tax=Geodia barretti TaxID=519541 RepID=A0AA35XCP5_GEOBA|nr:hypothetical protein GBAR_LOCUS25783 [Geodia barretti]
MPCVSFFTTFAKVLVELITVSLNRNTYSLKKKCQFHTENTTSHWVHR